MKIKKISELMNFLEDMLTAHGDIEVTIHCDQEFNAEGRSEDTISTILWEPEPKRLMLCDTHTFVEINDQQ